MTAQALANLSQRQLILFDLDGTLVDSAKDLYRSMNIALTDLNRPNVSEQQIRTWIGRGAGQLCECVILHQDGEFNSEKHQQLLQQFLSTYEKNVCVDTVLYDGVAEFLDYCQQQNKIMAIVTNKPYDATVNLLKALNLYERFDYIIGGDSLAQRKPSPEPLLHVVKHFNLKVAQTLMIGDSRNDVEAARSANIDCIALSYGYNHGENILDCQPQAVIDTLRTLIA